MKPAFQRFIKGIVRQTDGSRDEREDLYEELLTHLQCSFFDLQRSGYSEEEATTMAMRNFGDEQEIGRQLQQAMYPFRKEMLLALSISSLLFSYIVYISQLFIMGDAHIPWLIIAVMISSLLLFVTMQAIPILNRRFWINGLLLIHLFVFLYGFLLASDINSPLSIGLSIISILIIVLSIILLYRTTIYDFSTKGEMFYKDVRRLHFVNITTGLLLGAATLFWLWAALFFATDQLHIILFILSIPIVCWIISYAIQMRLLSKQKKKWAYAIASIQSIILLISVGYLLFNMFGGAIS